MKLIKLDAIDSTNDFLKGLASNGSLENFTVVTAQSQSKGRGQMGAKWESESGKNLIMSVFVKEVLLASDAVFILNVATTVAIASALESFNIPALRIKWPNDIMSDNYKIGGLLIENSFKSSGEVHSIIGLGLNVNQADFTGLPKASSLLNLTHKIVDNEVLLKAIIEEMKLCMKQIDSNPKKLWEQYDQLLFKKGKPMPFKNNSNQNFMGMVQGVSPDGQLQVILEDDSVQSYNLKEIQMLY